MQAYEAGALQKNATADVNNPMQAAPSSGINPIGPDGKVYSGPEYPMGMPGAPGTGVSEAIGDNKDMRDKMGELPAKGKTFGQMRQVLQNPEQPQQAQQPEKPGISDIRQSILKKRLAQMNQPSSLKSGAGANMLSIEDIGKFRNYIKNGAQNETEDITPDELDFAMGHLKEAAGKKWTGFQNRLKGKGDPAPERKVVSRAREIVESYLRNLGQSAIDGSPIAFSDTELDHGLSLSNGGLDQGDNWRWLPKRFNQFKGDLDDDALIAALQKEEDRQNDPDFQIKQSENEFINTSRSDWKDRFDTKGWENMNIADIREKKGAAGLQFLKALAEKGGVSYYKNREGPRASGRAGGGTQLGVEELQDRIIDELGIPDNVDVDNFDRGLFELLDRLEEQRSNLESSKRARRKEKREAKKKKA